MAAAFACTTASDSADAMDVAAIDDTRIQALSHAPSLVGKVNSFWDGKPLALGWDENGNLQIIHCTAGINGVTISVTDSFTAIGRPTYYGVEQ